MTYGSFRRKRRGMFSSLFFLLYFLGDPCIVQYV